MPEGATILLVDDEESIQKLLTYPLEREGFRVVQARDGEEALDYLFRRGAYESREPGEPAVVLLDLKLPKVSGTEVLQSIKDDPKLRTLPVVVLTSSREEQDLVRSYDLGTNA